MNTFSGQMLKDILELLDEAEKDDDIRAVIFTCLEKPFVPELTYLQVRILSICPTKARLRLKLKRHWRNTYFKIV